MKYICGICGYVYDEERKAAHFRIFLMTGNVPSAERLNPNFHQNQNQIRRKPGQPRQKPVPFQQALTVCRRITT